MGQYATVTVCVLMCVMIISTVGTQDCKSTIVRYHNVNKTVVCCKVTCDPGFFVDVCKVNGTADRCEPCPEGTYLDDITDSEFLVKCSPYDCLPESIPAPTFPPEPSCGKKCVCDVQRQYVGTDPCACRRATVTCTHGTSLTIDDTCEPIVKEMTNTTYGPSSTVYFLTTQEENPEYRTKETTVNSNVTIPSHNPGSEEDNDLVTILVILSVVIVFVGMSVAVVFGIFWYKKRKECTIERNGETDTNKEPENISLMPNQYTTHPTRTEDNALHIVENGSVNSCLIDNAINAKEIHQFDQNGKSNADEEMENISPKYLSTHPRRTESIKASHSSGNGSLNSYSRMCTGIDANKNCQLGTISSSTGEEMKGICVMPHNTHSTRTANNASSIVENGSVNSNRIDTERDSKEKYQLDCELGYAEPLSLGSLKKDKELSYDLEHVEPLSKPE